MPQSPRQIASLTPLRGVAALLVVVYHMDSMGGFLKLGSLIPGSGLFARGYLWVDFFFVLSGFIITHVYGDLFSRGIRREQVREFVAARFSRLYPLHAFSLCLTVSVYVGLISRMPTPDGGGFSMADIYDWKTLPLHGLLLLGFGLTGLGWNVPAWSIAAEWWTYILALPLFPLLNRGVSARTFLIPAACIAGLSILAVLHPGHTLDITFDFGLLRCFLGFTTGLCLYQLYRTEWGMRVFASDAALVVSGLLVAVTLHCIVPLPPISSAEFYPQVPPMTPAVDALCLLPFSALILCAAYNTGRGRRVLNVRPLVYLGDISYSIYMMQGTALLVFFVGAGAWRQSHPTGPMSGSVWAGLVAATLLGDLLLATATYKWVEVPARRWLRRRLVPRDLAVVVAAGGSPASDRKAAEKL